MNIHLERPAAEHREKALAFRQEFRDHGENVINGSERLDSIDSYQEWLGNVCMNADPATVNPDWVVTDTFFAVSDTGDIVGIIDFRHELKGFLKDFGHCGYSVRPGQRGKGCASAMLAQLIPIAEKAGLSSLQLSVERSNAASVKTILKNGGVHVRTFEYDGQPADVYCIRLSDHNG